MSTSGTAALTPHDRRALRAQAGQRLEVRAPEEVFLDPEGCPVCEGCAEREDAFFGWFHAETFADSTMHRRLKASVGFCAVHQRRVLRVPQLPPARAIVRGALAQLAVEAPARAECPACEATRHARTYAERLLAEALARPDLRARYLERECGVCLPHLAATIAGGDPDLARPLAEKLRHDLGTQEALELVAGQDPDAATRVALRGALPRGPGVVSHTTGTAARATWELDACPVCHEGAVAERRYLEWRRHEERADAPDLGHDPGLLCAAHLQDLSASDAEAGRRAAARVRSRWMAELDRALERWPSPRGPGARLLRRRGSQTRVNPSFCPACKTRAGAEARQLDLLLRLLAQRPYAEAYESTHGLCLRHVLLVGDRPASPLVRDALRARLSVVDWEIEEAARKQAWDARHERAGPEQTVLPRLAALVDGATFLGVPARELA